MPPVKTAVISFSSSKTCYISIPEYWKTTDSIQELAVFEIQYREKKAYVSWRGETVPSKELKKDVVQISRHYGSKLGLKDNEEVVLQQINTFVPPSNTIQLEPLSVDDWEIMKLNAGSVENDLLNQIQLIWKGLIFPLWVHKSTLLFFKVVEMVPNVQLAKLVEWTELQIIPKERAVDGTDETDSVFHSKVRKKNSIHRHSKHVKRFRKRSVSSPSFVSPVVQESEELKRNEEFQQSLLNIEDKKNENNSMLSIVRYILKSVFPQDPEQSNTRLNTSQKITKYIPDAEYYIPFQINLKLRVIPFFKNTNIEQSIPHALQATTAFINARALVSLCRTNEIPSSFVARISKLLSPSERQEKLQKAVSTSSNAAHSGSKDKIKKEKEASTKDKREIFDSICIKVIVVRSFENEFDDLENIFLSENSIAIPRELQRRLGLEVSSIVYCESVQYDPVFLDNVQLIPLSKLPSSITEEFVASAFFKWADEASNDVSPLIISDGTLVHLPAKGKYYDFVIGFSEIESPASSGQTSPSSQFNSSLGSITSEKSYSLSSLFSLVPQFGYLNKEVLNNINIKLGTYSAQLSKSIWCSSSTLHNDQVLDLKLPALRLEALGGIKILSEKGLEVLMFWLGLQPVASALSNGVASSGGRMLICGSKGIGRSTLAKALCRKLVDHPYYVFTKIVECRTLRGKRVETIAKKWESAYAEVVHRQPAVLFFDDLDLIASAPATPEQEAGPDGLYFSKVVQVFLCMLSSITNSDARIVVIATAKSSHTLHPSLTYTRGRHVFQTILDILPPNMNQREEILKSLVLSKTHLSTETMESVLWSKQAARTEGYVAQDLDLLIDRATHAAWLRTDLCLQVGNDGQVTLTDEDFEVALDRFTPASLRGLQLHISGNKTWKDVGGLHHVKKAIQEILLWPIKYHSLFSKCPLKPQSSILLYGAPGTGKTLLAGVVAKECGLNFISIKGPELLSKYIGASEQAIRDIFQRASSAKPCILFFDEFDAIAPRRGHDSTGVTDRVVNQLLTQMDGVESLQGVYVLAATSRPELIDPALLRPGRLDKCLHCPLPDEAERLEILEALSHHLTLFSDVDMQDIVKITEHFSGADLQALLYSSQLEALHEFQGLSSKKQSDNDERCCNLTVIENKLIYMPSVEIGKANPTSEEGQKLLQEINIIRDNVEGRNAIFTGNKHRKYSTLSIGIQQKHLMKVALQMKPSVSSDERQRYQEIYEKFVGSRGGDFSPSIASMKRVTLA